MTFDTSDLKATEGQKALAAYIKRETGKQVKPESIALVDALRTEFRKDPEQVATRQAVKDAARQRDEAALEKTLAKAKALAAKLGHAVEQEHGTEVVTLTAPVDDAEAVVAAADLTPEDVAAADDGFDEEPDEPLATVTSINKAGKRVVENDFGADTSAIDTVTEEDAFVVPSATEEVEDF